MDATYMINPNKTGIYDALGRSYTKPLEELTALRNNVLPKYLDNECEDSLLKVFFIGDIWETMPPSEYIEYVFTKKVYGTKAPVKMWGDKCPAVEILDKVSTYDYISAKFLEKAGIGEDFWIRAHKYLSKEPVLFYEMDATTQAKMQALPEDMFEKLIKEVSKYLINKYVRINEPSKKTTTYELLIQLFNILDDADTEYDDCTYIADFSNIYGATYMCELINKTEHDDFKKIASMQVVNKGEDNSPHYCLEVVFTELGSMLYDGYKKGEL